MTFTDITQIIANLGFPIAACIRICGRSSLLCRGAEALRSPITDSGALRRLLWIILTTACV